MRHKQETALILAYLCLMIIVVKAHFFFAPPASPTPVFVTSPSPEELQKDVASKIASKLFARDVANTKRVFNPYKGCHSSDLAVIITRSAHQYHVPGRIVAAVIVAESACKPQAVAHHWDMGLMQINTRIWRPHGNLLDPQLNISVGTRILAGYIHRYGLREGLHHYNGMGDPTTTYSDKIFAIAGWRTQ